MYDRILVALDGSDVAEAVLPYVEALGERFGSTLIFLRATTAPSPELAVSTVRTAPLRSAIGDYAKALEAERQEAASYLEALVDRLGSKGFPVRSERLEGHPADVLAQRARELEVDLIAMTTQGRGGLRRVVFGSVADAVLRGAPCPVLLVRVDPDGQRAT